VVRGAEEERLNHGGSRAEMCMHDVDNLSMPLGSGAGARLQVSINTRLATGDPDLYEGLREDKPAREVRCEVEHEV
jgi:hypothetical protein